MIIEPLTHIDVVKLKTYYQAVDLSELERMNPLGFEVRKKELIAILRLIATLETLTPKFTQFPVFAPAVQLKKKLSA